MLIVPVVIKDDSNNIVSHCSLWLQAWQRGTCHRHYFLWRPGFATFLLLNSALFLFCLHMYSRVLLFPKFQAALWSIINAELYMTDTAHEYQVKVNLRTQRVACCCSVTKSCLTLGNLMECIGPGSPVLHCLPEFAQIPVHWVHDAI